MKKIIVSVMLALALLVASADVTATAASYAKASHSHSISIKVGTGKTKHVRTNALTVADLLAQRHIKLGTYDGVKPSLTTRLKSGTKVVVKRVRVRTATISTTVYHTVVRKSAKLRRGLTKVLAAGKAGKAKDTYRIVRVNGKVAKKVRIKRVVTVAPSGTRVILLGTKGPKLNIARMSMWNRIARCESGGNWHINTGNGYYGGLQFMAASWRAAGGRDFARLPHLATKYEQITVANRLFAKMGTRPWGCA
jgi:uncharacterized protein YabE (DUF348 family)